MKKSLIISIIFLFFLGCSYVFAQDTKVSIQKVFYGIELEKTTVSSAVSALQLNGFDEDDIMVWPDKSVTVKPDDPFKFGGVAWSALGLIPNKNGNVSSIMFSKELQEEADFYSLMEKLGTKYEGMEIMKESWNGIMGVWGDDHFAVMLEPTVLGDEIWLRLIYGKNQLAGASPNINGWEEL